MNPTSSFEVAGTATPAQVRAWRFIRWLPLPLLIVAWMLAAKDLSVRMMLGTLVTVVVGWHAIRLLRLDVTSLTPRELRGVRVRWVNCMIGVPFAAALLPAGVVDVSSMVIIGLLAVILSQSAGVLPGSPPGDLWGESDQDLVEQSVGTVRQADR